MWVGEHFISYGQLISPEESVAALAAVTAADIRGLAQQVLRADRLSVAMILPGVTVSLKTDLMRMFGQQND
jgi:predicted Zn-dependent peptidase